MATTNLDDPELAAIARKCATGWSQSDSKIPSLAPFYKLREELSVDTGVLFRSDCAVIPISLRPC